MRGASLPRDRPHREHDALVAGNESELEQVVMNLCVNAAGAVARRDEATSGPSCASRAPDEAINPAALVLSVADDGVGMDAETVAHAFEPYFTRKSGERGIGLSVVYGVVKRAGGTVSAQSTPGGGTVFTVVLPRAPGRTSFR